MCNAIEIQKEIKLTKILGGWLYFEDLNGFKYALSKNHIYLLKKPL